MSTVFFPGCKFKAWWGDSTAQITALVVESGWADRVAQSCCRASELDLLPGEETLCLCNSCINSLRRRTDAKVTSFWTLLAAADDIKLPIYHGKSIALHRCGFFSYPAVEDAITHILGRMQVRVTECEKPQAAFGSAPQEQPAGPSALAHLFGPAIGHEGPGQGRIQVRGGGMRPGAPWQADGKPRGQGRIERAPLREQDRLRLAAYGRSIEVGSVYCYCTGCFGTLQGSGKRIENIVELAFPPRADSGPKQ